MARTASARLLRAAPAAIAVALALPFSVSAAQRPAAAHGPAVWKAGASFAFGRSGGNIAPSRIVIARTGKITAAPAQQHAGEISPDAVNGLLTLARAERFFSMPRATTCLADNPDFSGNYITVATPKVTKTVTVRGTCRPAFTQLYAVLGAAAGTG